ncbi:formylglycine-generating enzyme family protein [Streptomyces sp. NPDC001663]|uniref:formylglycine-generating enzyme family protein n=1 Tax=Streptomyces sp. NPDC001663 TaxID=3364597 RepID=UPI0036C86877
MSDRTAAWTGTAAIRWCICPGPTPWPFCRWEGSRLPTEAEWEYATRGGLEQKLYPWGDELTPDGEHRCNIWQGHFPFKNTAEDGYVGTAPVSAYRPSGYGLYNVAGNVWEWCADGWSTDHPESRPGTPRINPAGPPEGPARVMRGGSYLCHDSYCNRYRVAARAADTPTASVATPASAWSGTCLRDHGQTVTRTALKRRHRISRCNSSAPKFYFLKFSLVPAQPPCHREGTRSCRDVFEGNRR